MTVVVPLSVIVTVEVSLMVVVLVVSSLLGSSATLACSLRMQYEAYLGIGGAGNTVTVLVDVSGASRLCDDAAVTVLIVLFTVLTPVVLYSFMRMVLVLIMVTVSN